MKKLSKIKLNQFSKDELARRKLNALKGGCDCSYSVKSDCKCQCSGDTFDGVESVNAHYYSPPPLVYSY